MKAAAATTRTATQETVQKRMQRNKTCSSDENGLTIALFTPLKYTRYLTPQVSSALTLAQIH
eukprot:2992994-Pleurochrysis_carterae.AAC.1